VLPVQSAATMMGTTSSTAARLSQSNVKIRIRIQSVSAVTEDHGPQHPPKDVHSILRHHGDHVENRHRSFRVPGLKPDQLPPAIVVVFTSARDTKVSAPLDHRTDASTCGYYVPQHGQDLMVTSRSMWRLANPTNQHSCHAAISSLTLRDAHRGGADLAACTFDLADMVPESGNAVVGSEHFNMGKHWRLCAAIELIFPPEPGARELGPGRTGGYMPTRDGTFRLHQQVLEQDDEEELYIDSEDEGDIGPQLGSPEGNGDSADGSVIDTELNFWDDATHTSRPTIRGSDSAFFHRGATSEMRLQSSSSQEVQYEPEPGPEFKSQMMRQPWPRASMGTIMSDGCSLGTIMADGRVAPARSAYI
jgi:hypothetical protein